MRRVLCLLLAPVCAAIAGCGRIGGAGGVMPPTGPAVSVTVAGPASTRLNATAQFSATVLNSANQNVTWQVNGTTGGNSTNGTISSAGLYTAPASMPGGVVTVTAIAKVDASASGYVTEAIWNPVPAVNNVAATQVGANLNVLVDVTGTGFLPKSVLQVGGVAVATTFVSATELQATVPVVAGTTSVNVAVANPDPGAATSATVNAKVTLVQVTATAAARLLDQATFGPTLTDIQHVQNVGMDAWLNEQFAAPTTALASIPTNPLPDLCVNNNSAYPCAESEWWQTAITGNDQLRQRVAFAMSEMFVVSTLSIPGQSVPGYHNMLANDAFGNFRTMMRDVALQPAMGGYLNMLNSAKPATGQIANENFARELMQLFTTGLYMLNQDGSLATDGAGNPVPVYTQAQVQAFARAYTGWTYGVAGGGTPTKFPSPANWYDPMGAVESKHDTASKALLNGVTLPAGQTASQDLDGAMDNIFQHSNVGPFVCRQLIQHLVTSTPSPAYVARVSAVFANNGAGVRGDLKAVVKAILLDQEARAGDSNGSFDGGHLREPVLFVTAMMRGLGFTNTATNGSYQSLSNYTSKLNQEPYRANSVFNFFPPEYVIPGTSLNAPEFGIENTATAVLRLTLADQIANNKMSGFNVDLSATSAWGKLAANPGDLVDSLAVLLMHSQMPANMRSTIVNAITPLTNNAQRVRIATYLIITSSQYKVIH